MATIRRFQFDLSFDDGEGRRDWAGGLMDEDPPEPDLEPEPERPPPSPPEPMVPQSELERQLATASHLSRRQGHEEGRQVGRREAEVAAQKALTDMLARVEGGLRQVLADQVAAQETRRRNTLALALAIVRKLFPALVRTHGLLEVETTIRGFLAELVDEPKLVVRVGETWFPQLQERIGDIGARLGVAGHIAVLSDPRLRELDVRVGWGEGGIERDVTSIWQDVERIAGDLLAGLPEGPTDPRAPMTWPGTVADNSARPSSAVLAAPGAPMDAVPEAAPGLPTDPAPVADAAASAA